MPDSLHRLPPASAPRPARRRWLAATAMVCAFAAGGVALPALAAFAEDGAAHAMMGVHGQGDMHRMAMAHVSRLNALDHGAAPIEVALWRDEASITIAVHDHGPGVPAALRRRVFEPFFRPEGWTESSGGWGLGLSLVRQIAERHGGRADCDSGDDGLTRFIVELPARKAAALPPRASSPTV